MDHFDLEYGEDAQSGAEDFVLQGPESHYRQKFHELVCYAEQYRWKVQRHNSTRVKVRGHSKNWKIPKWSKYRIKWKSSPRFYEKPWFLLNLLYIGIKNLIIKY